MNPQFYELLDITLAEVCRREPTYASCFPLSHPYAAKMAAAYRQHPLCDKFHPETLEKALIEGLAYFSRSWSRSEVPVLGDDPLVRLLCDSIVDSFCADQGLLTLMPYDSSSGPLSGMLAQEYTERQAPGGPYYYIRNGGRDPLLLINATGTPLAIWRHFLADSTHDFKIIVPRRRGSDLFRGGLQCHVDIKTESADLASILKSESLQKTAVVAWCNGARVGIELANSIVDQISSLVLIGPMLKGVKGVSPSFSTFDRDLQPLLDGVTKEPHLAPLLSRTIAEQAKSPDWGRWKNAPAGRARALFGLPAKDHALGILACLTDSESFLNTARRVKSDEDYPMHLALSKLSTRTMVIMGSDDQIVSNELVSSAMKQLCVHPVVKVVLSGSGHYIHDLQYHYFRFLLNEFLHSNRKPPSTARIEVEDLISLDRPQINSGLHSCPN
jgi:pimeloyl-ACP methyl ester carboxylesterase